MTIHGIEKLTLADIEDAVAGGGRFVFYEYCISIVFASARRPTAVVLLRPGDWGVARGLPYCLVSLLFGWWGMPSGVIYTPLTLFNNLCGGCDVTDETLAWLAARLPGREEPDSRTQTCDPA